MMTEVDNRESRGAGLAHADRRSEWRTIREPGDGERLLVTSSAGVDRADAHHSMP